MRFTLFVCNALVLALRVRACIGRALVSLRWPPHRRCRAIRPIRGTRGLGGYQALLWAGPADESKKGISEADWRDFLDREVTPRFPSGLSVVDVYGQWQGKNEQRRSGCGRRC